MYIYIAQIAYLSYCFENNGNNNDETDNNGNINHNNNNSFVFGFFIFNFAIFFGFICLFRRRMPINSYTVISLLKGEVTVTFERFNFVF